MITHDIHGNKFYSFNFNEGGRWVTLHVSFYNGRLLIRNWFFGLGFSLAIGGDV